MQVFFLMQSGSVDEQRSALRRPCSSHRVVRVVQPKQPYARPPILGRYRSSLRCEREAFQSLILERKQMAPPEEWEGLRLRLSSLPLLPGQDASGRQAFRSESGAGADDLYVAPNGTTRHAGGRLPSLASAAAGVVVDLREFRSALPNMLHLHGFDVTAVTMEVGDYVLSGQVCVERKSIPDLVQSLASGRLYSQAEAMSRYYRRPTLLIECDELRPFGLVNAGDLGPEVSAASALSRLALLLLHFPQLRLLWSRSPSHTACMFRALKNGMPEPDAPTAAAVGLPGDTADAAFNMTPQDMLRQLPGVYAHNYRRLMHSALNLENLAARSLVQLETTVGGANAMLLHAFLQRR